MIKAALGYGKEQKLKNLWGNTFKEQAKDRSAWVAQLSISLLISVQALISGL